MKVTGQINVFNPAAFKKQFEPLKLNLQYFSEPNNPPADPPNSDDPPSDPPAKIELSAEELQKKIEAESDRKLSKALEKKQKEWEAQLDQRIDDAKKDAEQYAKMTQKEREDAEYKKRLEALDKRERELNTKQLRSEVETDLKDEGLPAAFAESLIKLEDNEKIKETVTSIKKEFDAAVNNAVKEKLRQDPPETGGSKLNNSSHTSKAEMARKNRIIK
jgi:Domain of unknown function (DUF4355)